MSLHPNEYFSSSENHLSKNDHCHKKKTFKSLQLYKTPKISKKTNKKIESSIMLQNKEFLSASEVQIKHMNSFPPKFLQPIHTYDIYGFFFMYDRGFANVFNSNEERVGLYEAINFYRKITRIERLDGELNVIFSDDTNMPKVPYKLITSQLMSLNDAEANELAIIIEKFCSLQQKTLETLDQNEDFIEYKEIENKPNDTIFDHNYKSKGLLHNIVFEEMGGYQSGKEFIFSNFKEHFANEEEFKAYDNFILRNERYLKQYQAEGVYTVRYKAKAGLDSYKTMNHFFSSSYSRMICPDESFYLSRMFKKGHPNSVKCSSNYFRGIIDYLQKLHENFVNHQSDELFSIEIEEKDGIGYSFDTIDGISLPIGLKLSVDIFRGKKFIEVMKRTHFVVSKENREILFSEERKRNYIKNFKIKKYNLEETVSDLSKKQHNITENEFISYFYPGVIPKNEISKNQSKICQFKEIKNI